MSWKKETSQTKPPPKPNKKPGEKTKIGTEE